MPWSQAHGNKVCSAIHADRKIKIIEKKNYFSFINVMLRHRRLTIKNSLGLYLDHLRSRKVNVYLLSVQRVT